MNKPSIELPEKLSDGIEVALRDLAQVEQDPNYIVEMGHWHESNSRFAHGKCAVCLAGSVISKAIPRDRTVRPHSFDLVTERKLLALNNIRVGAIYNALLEWHNIDYFQDPPHPIMKNRPKDREVTQYSKSSCKFHCDLRQIINELRAVNL